MKTVICTLNSRPDRDRGLPKVVDLAAWRAEHLDEPAFVQERHRSRAPARRRSRRTALDWAELAATLAVTAAFIALAARVLLF